jgi:hypothetical protein
MNIKRTYINVQIRIRITSLYAATATGTKTAATDKKRDLISSPSLSFSHSSNSFRS